MGSRCCCLLEVKSKYSKNIALIIVKTNVARWVLDGAVLSAEKYVPGKKCHVNLKEISSKLFQEADLKVVFLRIEILNHL